MTLEIFLWVVGITVIPVVGFGIRLYWMTSKLLDMHENPEHTGFGTNAVAGTLASVARAVEGLTKWLVEQEEKDHLRRKLLLAEIKDVVEKTVKEVLERREN